MPAWTTLITQHKSNQVESVQETSLYLVYGTRFKLNTWALGKAQMSTQKIQRAKIFEKFTKTCINSPKFSKWFVQSDEGE